MPPTYSFEIKLPGEALQTYLTPPYCTRCKQITSVLPTYVHRLESSKNTELGPYKKPLYEHYKLQNSDKKKFQKFQKFEQNL